MTIIHIRTEPALPCHQCGRMTNYAEFEPAGPRVIVAGYPFRDDPRIAPACPIHDYTEAYTQEEQAECVRRFIQDELQADVKVSGIERCSLADSGYEHPPDAIFDAYAWRVVYMLNDQEMRAYVVFPVDELRFFLLRSTVEQASL